jgi:hypothetical protein
MKMPSHFIFLSLLFRCIAAEFYPKIKWYHHIIEFTYPPSICLALALALFTSFSNFLA